MREKAISGASAHEFGENVREGARLGDERMKWRGGGRRARRGGLADEPFVAGEEGEELGGDGAAVILDAGLVGNGLTGDVHQVVFEIVVATVAF